MAPITVQHMISLTYALSTGPADRAAVLESVKPYLSPSYVQNRGGVESGFDDTVDHLVQVRGAIKELEVEMLDFIADRAVEEGKAGKVATRHLSTVKMNDGKESRVEVALFGKVDDNGLFTYIYELSRTVDQLGTVEFGGGKMK